MTSTPLPIIARLRPYLRIIEAIAWIGWASFTAFSLWGPVNPDHRMWLVAYNFAAGLYTLFLFHYLIDRFGTHPVFYFAQMTYGVIVCALSVWLTDGLNGTLDAFMALLVVGGAVVGGRRLGLYTATLAMAATLVLDLRRFDPSELILSTILRGGVFGALALMVHTGMEYMAAQGQRAVELTLQAARQTARQLAQMQALHAMSVAVGSSLDLPVVLNLALAKATEVLRLDAGLIVLANVDTQNIETAAHHGLSERLSAQTGRFKLRIGEGLIGAVMTDGRPVCTDDLAHAPRLRLTNFPSEGFRSFIGIPLKNGAQSFGALIMLSREALLPDASDLEFLGAIGEQLGLAIQHARSYSAEYAQRRLAESFSRIAQAIGEGRDLPWALDVVLAELQTVVPYGAAAVLVRESDALAAKSSRGRTVESANTLGHAIVTPAVWRDLERGEPVTAGDVALDPLSGIRAWVCEPLTRPDGLAGALLVDFPEPRAFTADELQLLVAFARQATTAIDRAQLVARADRRLQQLAALNLVGQAVSSALELPRVLQTAYEQVLSLTGNRDFYVALYDEAADEVRFPLYYEHGNLIQRESRHNSNGLTEHVIHQRRAVLINDDLSEYGRRNNVTVLGTPAQSWLGVPLLKGARIIGAMAVQDYERAGAYDSEDVELLQTLAGQLSVAIDNAQFYESVRRNLAETEALFAFAQRARETSDMAAIAEAAVAAALAVMPVDDAILHLSDGDPPVLTPLSAFVNGHAYSAAESRRPVEDMLGAPAIGGVTGWVLTHRQAQRIGDVRRDSRFVGNLDMRSELCMPIIRRDQVLGVFNVECAALDAYDARHERFMQTLAGHLAVAIESARLAEAERQRARELAGQYEISQAFGALGSTRATYAEVTRRIAQVFGVQSAVILLYDDETKRMRAQEPAYGASPELLADAHYLMNEFSRAVWDPYHEPVWIVNDVEGATASVRRLASRFDARQWLAAAMFGQGGLIGALYIFKRIVPGQFTARDGQLMVVLARQAALAIENARLIDTERRSRMQLALVNQIDRLAGSSLDLDPLMRDLVRRIREAWRYPGVSIFYAEGDELVQGASDAAWDAPPGYRQPISQGTLGWVARHRQPRLVNDVTRAKEFVDPAGIGMRSELIVPLIARDELVGVLALAGDQPNEFDGADLAAMQTIADQVAQAIFNARLYQTERRRANQIATVSQLGREITSMLNLSDLLNRSVQLVCTQFQFARVRIFLADFEKDIAWVAAAAGQDKLSSPSTLPIRSLAAAARAINEQRPFHDETDPRAGVLLAVPIHSAERTLGALEVQARSSIRFGADDEAIVQTLADQLAVAISNAELHMAVERQARTDSLTGVFNHSHFLERLQDALSAAVAGRASLSLIMLDIDYFKQYNDKYGHVMGDRVLGTIVQAIRRNIKQGDIVGRWGGEEFGIGLPGANAGQALRVAGRIRATLAGMPLADERGRDIPKPTISQGLAVYPDHGQTLEELVDLSDRMLYEAKSRGRDQVILYSPDSSGIQIRLPIQEDSDEQA
ncbi:MAG: GAF domain-containing protein [Chloroflexi bacterium]|nr:GAF domain-containing protein [Chloroflexota bacterium]